MLEEVKGEERKGQRSEPPAVAGGYSWAKRLRFGRSTTRYRRWFCQSIEYPIRRPSIPQRRNFQIRFIRRIVESAIRRGDDFSCISSGDRVRAHLDRDRALSVFAQRDTGNSQHGRLFLNAARVRQHQSRATHQFQKIQIAGGLDHHETLRVLEFRREFQFVNHFSRAWMSRKNNRYAPANLFQRMQDPPKRG